MHPFSIQVFSCTEGQRVWGLAAADCICHSVMAVYTLDTLLVIILNLILEITFFQWDL